MSQPRTGVRGCAIRLPGWFYDYDYEHEHEHEWERTRGVLPGDGLLRGLLRVALRAPSAAGATRRMAPAS
ncbi:MAG: hypothetical protein ACKPJJ_21575, partial [Planctomycetaceae bacterium]